MLQLFGCRHHLFRLQRLEQQNADSEAAKKQRRNTISELAISEFERQELMRLFEDAEGEHGMKKYDHLLRNLPTFISKMISGYSLKCFWFEVVECVRKALLVAVPAVFEAGTHEQLFLGLLTCFATFALYALYQPCAQATGSNGTRPSPPLRPDRCSCLPHPSMRPTLPF